VFLGEYQYRLDEKGRIGIPPKFRQEFRDGLVLARGIEGCITVYPVSEWKKIAEKLNDLPPTRSKTRRINRFTFATAFYAELDGQGRIALPLPLRQYAGIGSSVVIVGVNNYLELWSETNWEAEKALMEEQAWQLSEGMEVRQH
jgi:MraZ protein